MRHKSKGVTTRCAAAWFYQRQVFAVSRAPGAVTGDWWRDRLSLFATLALVGLPVWLLHWQPRTEAEAGSLARRMYLYVSPTGAGLALLALLASGAATVYRLLGLLLHATNSDGTLVDVAHAAAIAPVVVGLTAYHWRIVRADSQTTAHERTSEPAQVVVESSAPSAAVLDMALQSPGDRGISIKRRPDAVAWRQI